MARRIPKYLLDELLYNAKRKCKEVLVPEIEPLVKKADKIVKEAAQKVKITPHYKADASAITGYRIRSVVDDFGTTSRFYTAENESEVRINVSVDMDNKDSYEDAVRKQAGKALKDVTAEILAKIKAVEKQFDAYRMDLIMGGDVKDLPEFNPTV